MMIPTANWLSSGSASTEPPLILLHGFLGSKHEWQNLLPQLSQKLHRQCLAWDLPGHGQNQDSDCHFENMAAQFWHALDQAGIEKIHLLGYSLGARLALYLLSQTPERIDSCILESGSPGLGSELERKARRLHDEQLALQLENADLKDFLERWYQQPLFSGLHQLPEFSELLNRRFKENQGQTAGLARALRQAGTGIMPALWEQLPRLNKPVLLLVGANDQKFVLLAQRMLELNPSWQIKTLAGGHCPHLEAPHDWLQAVADFISHAVSKPLNRSR